MKELLEFAFFDSLKLDTRAGKHVVTFYRRIRNSLDNGWSLQVTNHVAHFILHAQANFEEGRDKIYIKTTPAKSGALVVDYSHIMKGKERIDMPKHQPTEKPMVYVTTDWPWPPLNQIDEIVNRVGYEMYSASRDGITVQKDSLPETRKQSLELNTEQIERCSLLLAGVDSGLPEPFFEMGYAHAVHKPIFLFTTRAFDVFKSTTVESILAILKTPGELSDALRMYYPIASPLASPNFRAAEVLGNIQAKYRQLRREYQGAEK